MTLREYIKKYYDNSPTWFQDEVTNQWHFERVQNILDLKEYLSGKHAILNRPNEQYNGILSNASDLLIDQTMPLDFDKFIFKIGEIDMQSKLYREIKRKAMRELLGIA